MRHRPRTTMRFLAVFHKGFVARFLFSGVYSKNYKICEIIVKRPITGHRILGFRTEEVIIIYTDTVIN